MALLVVNTAISPGIDLNGYQGAIIGPSGMVYSSGGSGILATGDNMSIYISGTVLSETDTGVLLGFTLFDSTGLSMTIAKTGYVQAGEHGVWIFGQGTITNHGTISARTGILVGDGGGERQLCTIYNTGVIDAKLEAIASYSNRHQIFLKNEGLIRSVDTAFSGSGQSDYITNNGVMDGYILLGAGDDTYVGTKGRSESTIYGQDGADTFFVGLYDETIDGGAGRDILNFSQTTGVKVALDSGFSNTGVAAGDSYENIEVIFGSNIGADALRGDDRANILYGLGGNDTLAGMAGNDGLVGGFGTDVLIGGLGNDAFVFAAPAQAGDIITDFSNALGNNDFFRIVAAGFGAGLTAGPLAAAKFYATNTNLAHDADDRFIFRTTDKTLWFDANGNAAGGLAMIADLQASATMTAADIVLV